MKTPFCKNHMCTCWKLYDYMLYKIEKVENQKLVRSPTGSLSIKCIKTYTGQRRQIGIFAFQNVPNLQPCGTLILARHRPKRSQLFSAAYTLFDFSQHLPLLSALEALFYVSYLREYFLRLLYFLGYRPAIALDIVNAGNRAQTLVLPPPN